MYIYIYLFTQLGGADLLAQAADALPRRRESPLHLS